MPWCSVLSVLCGVPVGVGVGWAWFGVVFGWFGYALVVFGLVF